MTSLTLEELKEVLAQKLDAYQIAEDLEIDARELLDKFSDSLVEYRWKYRDIEEEYLEEMSVPWEEDGVG